MFTKHLAIFIVTVGSGLFATAQTTSPVNGNSGVKNESFCDSLHLIMNNSANGFIAYRYNEKTDGATIAYNTLLPAIGFDNKFIRTGTVTPYKQPVPATLPCYMATKDFTDILAAYQFYIATKKKLQNCLRPVAQDSTLKPGYTRYTGFQATRMIKDSFITAELIMLSDKDAQTVVFRLFHSKGSTQKGNMKTPTGTTPVVTNPVATNPVVTNPVTKPVVTNPVTKPVVTSPVEKDPVVTTPPITDTVAKEPVVINTDKNHYEETVTFLQALIGYAPRSFVAIRDKKLENQQWKETYSSLVSFRKFTSPMIEYVADDLWNRYTTRLFYKDEASATKDFTKLAAEIQSCSAVITSQEYDLKFSSSVDKWWNYKPDKKDSAGQSYKLSLNLSLAKAATGDGYYITLLFSKNPG